jgi:hypothetical protein
MGDLLGTFPALSPDHEDEKSARKSRKPIGKNESCLAFLLPYLHKKQAFSVYFLEALLLL